MFQDELQVVFRLCNSGKIVAALFVIIATTLQRIFQAQKQRLFNNALFKHFSKGSKMRTNVWCLLILTATLAREMQLTGISKQVSARRTVMDAESSLICYCSAIYEISKSCD